MSNIASGNAIAEIAAMIGDVARANILSALMGGRALTAGELAWHAGVSAQTTTGHLTKLIATQLITLERQQGRHRYFRLASSEVAHAMEALMTVAAAGPKRHRPTGPKDEAMRMLEPATTTWPAVSAHCFPALSAKMGMWRSRTVPAS